MKRDERRAAGAPGKAPLLGKARFARRVALVTDQTDHEPGDNLSRAGLSSVDFQTRRVADPPESAEREAALEVGLEICAARPQERNLLII